MYIDKALQMSNAQAVTVTAPSTDVVDFGQVNPNSGFSDMLKVVVTTGVAATAAGAATVTVTAQDSADNSSWADIASTAAIPKASLVIGYQAVIPMPLFHRRYVRVNYTVATGPLTAGTFSAQIVTGIQSNTAYPDAL